MPAIVAFLVHSLVTHQQSVSLALPAMSALVRPIQIDLRTKIIIRDTNARRDTTALRVLMSPRNVNLASIIHSLEWKKKKTANCARLARSRTSMDNRDAKCAEYSQILVKVKPSASVSERTEPTQPKMPLVDARADSITLTMKKSQRVMLVT